jgi:3',5'-cyclic AMP phosphodiesterase CpdA
MKFIHLTDLHLVPPGGRLYGLDPNQRLRAAVADIARHHRDADFVLVTGDLVHRGEVAAYQALRTALDALPLPYHLLLGNHDQRESFRAAFPEAPVDPNGFVQQIVETSAGPLILLDTSKPGTHAGWLCGQRLEWLDRALADCSGRGTYLALHHPPLALGIPCMDVIALTQQKALGDMLLRHGSVRHMFFGHVHRPVHGTWNGIPFSTHRGLNHQVALTFEDVDGIPGTHEPPSYAVVTVTGATTIVHVHDFLDASPRFDLFDRRAEAAASTSELIGGARGQPLTVN